MGLDGLLGQPEYNKLTANFQWYKKLGALPSFRLGLRLRGRSHSEGMPCGYRLHNRCACPERRMSIRGSLTDIAGKCRRIELNLALGP